MKPLKEYDQQSILAEELFKEIFEEEDIIQRSYMIAELSIRAKELKVKSQFDMIIKNYEKVIRETRKEEKIREQTQSSGRITEFHVPMEARYSNMECGSWFATESGIVS